MVLMTAFLRCTCLSLFTDKEMAQITASCLPEIALLTPRIYFRFYSHFLLQSIRL